MDGLIIWIKKNQMVATIIIALIAALSGSIYLLNDSSKVLQCNFLPNKIYKKSEPEFFELKGDKVVACGQNGLGQYWKVSRQSVTSSTISYTCTFGGGAINTYVTVNRYSGKADLHYGDDYLNSHEGRCAEVSGSF